MTLLRRLVLAAALTTALAASAQATTSYSFQTYALPEASSTSLLGVNNGGVLVGSAIFDGRDYGVVIDGGTVTRLAGPADAIGAFAADASANGTVVGNYWTTTFTDPDTGDVSQGPNSAYIYNGSTYTSFTLPSAYDTVARGISADGRFVSGYYTDDSGFGVFVYDTSGALPVQKFGGGPWIAIGQGVSASGVVAGSDRVVGDDGRARRVGFTYDALTGEEHEYAFDGYSGTGFRDITSDGRIGGYLETTDLANADLGLSYTHGFFGTPDQFQLIDVPWAVQTYVEGVNDAGVLVGFYTNADGTSGSFIATPVPEPATWGLSLAGLLSIGLLRRRRA